MNGMKLYQKIFRVFLILTVLVLPSCMYLKAYQIRSQAEQLYKEGRTPEIIPLIENALPEFEQEFGPDHHYIAEAYNGLAQVYAYSLNDFKRSEEYFQRALDIRERTQGPEHPDTIETLSLMGFLYKITGNFPKAEEFYTKALALREKVLGPDHPDTAETQVFLGGLYLSQSQFSKAESILLKASKNEEHKVSTRHPSPADSLILLGSLYSALGDNDRAETYYRETLAIRERELGKEHASVALSLDTLGFFYKRKGDFDQAEQYFLKSQKIKEKAFGKVHGFTADSSLHLGILYRDRKDYDRAAEYFQQALDVYKQVLSDDNYRVLGVQNQLAVIHIVRKDHAAAKKLCEEILATANKGQVKAILGDTLFLYSVTFYQLKNNNAAIFYGKQAVNNIQEIRARLTGMESELQKNFIKNREHAFKYLAGLLIEEGRLPEAQQVMSMIKEREFFEYIRRDATKKDILKTTANFSQVEQPWMERFRGISDKLAGIGREMQLLKRKKKMGISQEDDLRLRDARQDIKVAKKAFQHFLVELENELKKVTNERAREIGEKNLDKLKAMQGTLRELGDGVVLIHYLITDEKLHIILTTSQVQLVRSGNIKSSDLHKHIFFYREMMQDLDEDLDSQAKVLFDILIAPIAGDLKQAKAITLMVSMDGALRYVPLSSLHDGEHYVAEEYQVVMFTEAAQTKLISKPGENWEIAGLGITKKIEGFSQLPTVKNELDSLVREGPDDSDGILPGVIYFDSDFTADSMLDVLDKSYPVLHIASHFVFKPGTERDSFLLLGDGNKLSLDQISEEDFDFNNVDLLTLSACETAMGGANANGQEIEGFGWLAQRQGAKAVLATLWPVADESTGKFMQEVYRSRENEQLSKAAALQKAQIKFLHSEKYRHPFFWAPFILMGNWL